MGEEAAAGKNWSRVAALYAKSVDETDLKSASGAAATQILRVIDDVLPLDQASFILDIGCGNGQVISRVLGSSKHAGDIPDSARIVAADVSQQFLGMLEERKEDRSKQSQLWSRLEVQQWDASDLRDQVADAEVSHLLASFAYFSMKDEVAEKALPEAFRILKPSGVFVQTSMGWTEWGQLPQLVKQVRPEKVIPGPSARWQSVEGVTKILSDAGFRNVAAREFEVTLPVDRYEDAIVFCFEGFPFMRSLVADMSDDEVARVKQLMLEFLRERHAEQPLRLVGNGYIGYGVK